MSSRTSWRSLEDMRDAINEHDGQNIMLKRRRVRGATILDLRPDKSIDITHYKSLSDALTFLADRLKKIVRETYQQGSVE